ncbi:hypothetical protein PGTUg99_025679 [Puccinia graminis f. sp. tritici]|uniref:Uncharacterized protein n=1 Tax=Puccinia graminis f. sp. tritici TaxID=56615 RepID=A0A5B0SMJ7_PUCGR|nr:hypothetical protein PGTUg99_025679 [Puccinia graminis f. sp. tritici]
MEGSSKGKLEAIDDFKHQFNQRMDSRIKQTHIEFEKIREESDKEFNKQSRELEDKFQHQMADRKSNWEKSSRNLE